MLVLPFWASPLWMLSFKHLNILGILGDRTMYDKIEGWRKQNKYKTQIWKAILIIFIYLLFKVFITTQFIVLLQFLETFFVKLKLWSHSIRFNCLRLKHEKCNKQVSTLIYQCSYFKIKTSCFFLNICILNSKRILDTLTYDVVRPSIRTAFGGIMIF